MVSPADWRSDPAAYRLHGTTGAWGWFRRIGRKRDNNGYLKQHGVRSSNWCLISVSNPVSVIF